MSGKHKRELIQRLLWALIGYITSVYGVVDLPVRQTAEILSGF